MFVLFAFYVLQAAGGSTSALLGDYSEALPTPMSMRTPATPVGEDVVMQASYRIYLFTLFVFNIPLVVYIFARV